MRVANAPNWLSSLSLSASASAWMHLLRASAAILVLLYHWRNVFFVDYAELEKSNLGLIFIYFLTGLGHQAVIAFFVLSGFFVGNVVLNDFYNNRLSPIKYAIDRLTRLYVVLLPSLIACFAWDYMGQKIYGLDGIYGGAWPSLTYSVVERGTIQVFFGNILYLQNILVHPYGSNNPLWSLANEFWYYVLFPCCFYALICRNHLIRIFLTSVFFCLIAFLGFQIVIGFLYWNLGVIISLLVRKTLIYEIRFGWIGLAFASLGFLIALACVRLHWIASGLWADSFIAIIFSLFLIVLIHARVGVSLGKYSEKLSAFSFSLYLVHMPPLVFSAAIMKLSVRYQPNFSTIMGAFGILLILILWSWFFYLCTEKYTSDVRSWLYGIFGFNSKESAVIN